jgi:curved DNA-binding protein CbpA
MSRPMDDYYELLGVDADAPVNDIRAAYRDKKAAVADTGTEKAKADAAALNKAWNVLSDPYQRGRYDQQLAGADGTDADGAADDNNTNDSDAPPPARRRPAKSNPRADARRDARTAKPTVVLPAGMAFPSMRKRRTAMFIDLAVLLALFLASQFLVITLEKSNHRAAYDKVTQLNGSGSGSISKAHAATSAAKKKASANVNCATHPTAVNDKAYCDASDAEKALNTQLTHEESVLAPLSNLISGSYFLLSLLILMIPSLFGGATLGKRQQRIRVVRLDGSPARAMDIFRRYAVLVFAAYVLTLFLRSPVGAVIVVFIVSISRNPNSQALHDRFARTLVVTDADE